MKFGVTWLKVPDSKLIGPNHGPLKKVDSGVFYGIKLLISQDLRLVMHVAAEPLFQQMGGLTCI